jgi:DNA-binding NarL/FixJ family response regulator
MPTRVLIVDDDEAFRGLVKRLLGEAGTVISEAADGENAVKIANEKHPELVLMDIGLPRVDGVEATRRIKAEHPEMKIILLTSLQEEAYLSATGKSGADLLLPKQSVRAEIVSAIRSLIPDFSRHWDGRERRRKQVPSSKALTWDGFERRRRTHPPGNNGRAA